MKSTFCACLLFLFCTANVQAGARDFFKEFEKDFGTTPRGPLLTHYFLVKNTTNQNLNIGAPRVSCGCVSASVLKSVVAPGETTAVYAAMDTNRIPHPYVTKAVTVYVPFYGNVMEEVTLKVQAIARDDMVLTPNAMALGNVVHGRGSEGSVRFTLYGGTKWEVSEAACSGIYVKPAVTVNRSGNETTYEVKAMLDPQCPVGNWTAEIWLKSSTPGLERVRVPVTVNVVPPISVTPDALTLNNLNVGKEIEHRVMLKGSEAFRILQVKGVNDVFSVKAPSENSSPLHTLTITVKPIEAGNLTTTLEIETDNKEMPRISVPVKANVAGK